MKIQYASDLHLEFSDNYNYLKRNPLQVTGDILLLAGDIGYLNDDNYDKHPFWDWACENYKQVVVIPGNHEFYKYFDLSTLYNGWTLKIRENVHCYYNAVITIGNVDIIASTLWSHIRLEDAYATERSVSDFTRIRYGNEPLDWARFNDEHSLCLNFIKESVANSKAKHIVVATHHVPSFYLMASEYAGSKINGAFTVELFDYIADSPINYWIYGHSHRNIDRQIAGTMCLSNQLGYVFRNEQNTFNPSCCIEFED